MSSITFSSNSYLFWLLSFFLYLFVHGNCQITFPVSLHHHSLSFDPFFSLKYPNETHLIKVFLPTVDITNKYSHLLNREISKTNTNDSPSKIEILANVVEYFIDVHVGTPPVHFTVQLDTGSSVSALPDARCVSCHSKNAYDPQLSKTSRPISCSSDECSNHNCDSQYPEYCLFQITYGDGSNIQGGLINDIFILGNHSHLNVTTTFGSILRERGSFEMSVDGIFGMAYYNPTISCVPNCVLPLLDNIIKANNLPNVFALSLEAVDTPLVAPGGYLVIGGTGLNASNQISYVPIMEEYLYVVELRQIFLGDVGIIPQKNVRGISVLDSGTTLLILPQDIYTNLVSTFQSKYCDLPGVCGPVNIFQPGVCLNTSEVSPDIRNKFPNISFVIDELEFQLPATYYLVSVQFYHSLLYCMGFTSNKDFDIIVLGDIFMKAYYIVFDRENKRVGFLGSEGSISRYPFPPAPPFLYVWQIIVMCIGICIYFSILCTVIIIGTKPDPRTRRYQLLDTQN